MDLAAFRAAYSAFLRPGRILLTGHSHQAWPDVAAGAQARVFADAADLVDDKWERIAAVEARVAKGVAERLGYATPQDLSFGRSTHELVFRLLSCFPLDSRTRIVSTTSEFHSLDRQLRRLAEEGVQVDMVDARDRASLPERLLLAITPGTSLVAVSAVLFEDAYVLPHLADIAARARDAGAALLVDAYHAFNVVPLPLADLPGEVYVTAGGYKYAQFGDGCCFLRLPPGCERRPLYTGWFADFEHLGEPRGEGPRPVRYGRGAARFAGATFDASALYRAAAVLDHFERFGLGVAELRAISVRQTARILSAIAEAGLPELVPLTARDAERRGGFVASRCPFAAELVGELRREGVYADSRGTILRLGPAPYLLDEEIDEGVSRVLAAVRRPGR
jgi:selenocysteine lyase/cysteine desulfurase